MIHSDFRTNLPQILAVCIKNIILIGESLKSGTDVELTTQYPRSFWNDVGLSNCFNSCASREAGRRTSRRFSPQQVSNFMDKFNQLDLCATWLHFLGDFHGHPWKKESYAARLHSDSRRVDYLLLLSTCLSSLHCALPERIHG